MKEPLLSEQEELIPYYPQMSIISVYAPSRKPLLSGRFRSGVQHNLCFDKLRTLSEAEGPKERAVHEADGASRIFRLKGSEVWVSHTHGCVNLEAC